MGHTLAAENCSWLVGIGPAISQHKPQTPLLRPKNDYLLLNEKSPKITEKLERQKKIIFRFL